MLAIPLWFLYEVGIVVGGFIERSAARSQAT
jgi:Sec-independent protein secretion pathway component TatC